MIVGTVKEIKNHEYRVGLTPESVHELTAHGHRVLVESGAGLGIGASDEAYAEAGAELVATAADIFAKAEMIVKVKEPQPVERAMLREGRSSTPISTSPPIPSRRRIWSSRARCASPMKP
jgi:alanine dehydrogenase